MHNVLGNDVPLAVPATTKKTIENILYYTSRFSVRQFFKIPRRKDIYAFSRFLFPRVDSCKASSRQCDKFIAHNI